MKLYFSIIFKYSLHLNLAHTPMDTLYSIPNHIPFSHNSMAICQWIQHLPPTQKLQAMPALGPSLLPADVSD